MLNFISGQNQIYMYAKVETCGGRGREGGRAHLARVGEGLVMVSYAWRGDLKSLGGAFALLRAPPPGLNPGSGLLKFTQLHCTSRRHNSASIKEHIMYNTLTKYVCTMYMYVHDLQRAAISIIEDLGLCYFLRECIGEYYHNICSNSISLAITYY